MISGKESDPAFVLWLISKKGIRGWRQLCSEFGCQAARDPRRRSLRESLEKLINLGFYRFQNRHEEDEFEQTGLLDRFVSVLGLSLDDLAFRTDDSITVTPALKVLWDERYRYDIFVLMPFSPKLKVVYEGPIKGAAKTISRTVARADRFLAPGIIMDEVFTSILLSKIILADCTGRNANVFYEIGLAHALGKLVVLTSQRDADVPFDLKHRRYIRYSSDGPGLAKFEIELGESFSEVFTSLAKNPGPE